MAKAKKGVTPPQFRKNAAEKKGAAKKVTPAFLKKKLGRKS